MFERETALSPKWYFVKVQFPFVFLPTVQTVFPALIFVCFGLE